MQALGLGLGVEMKTAMGMGMGMALGDRDRQEEPATMDPLGRVPEMGQGKPGYRLRLTHRHRRGLERVALGEEAPARRDRVLERTDLVPTAGALPAAAFHPAQ
jgi:hypothetical protein